jgi:GH24 family phage-related lysozyme (muramidase)
MAQGLLDIVSQIGRGFEKIYDEQMPTMQEARGLLGLSPTQAAETTPAESTAAADRDYIVNFIADREGYIPTARIPTRGDRLTVGYGHTQGVRQGQTMTEEEARQALSDDIDSRLPEIRRAIPQFDNLTAEAQAPLISEWFRGSLVQSRATRRLINQGRYDQAATEFLNNDEYRNAVRRNRRGIRQRMEETSNAIRNMGNSVR